MTTLRPFMTAIALAALLACSKTEDKPQPPNEPTGPVEPAAAKDAAARPAPAIDAATPAPEPIDAAAATAPTVDAGGAAVAPDDPDNAPPKNLKILPKSMSRKDVVAVMKTRIGKGLGVKCDFCHDTKDFAADGNEHKDMSRKMMKMTADMNKKFFDGKDEITCFTCHKGHDEPEEE